MTGPMLLFLIAAALLGQIGVGAGIAFWRYQRRRARFAAPAPVALRGAWAGWRQFRVVGRQYEDAAQSQCSFHLAPLDGKPLPPYKPGQFLTFRLTPDPAAPDRPLVRCYSLSDQPDPARWRITVKRVPAPAGRADLPPGVGSGYLHDWVQAGDVLDVRAPAGGFWLDPDPATPAVLIAGGIGITPMLSMAAWALSHQPGRAVHLFYGVRDGAELAFGETLAAFARTHPAFHLHRAFSRPRPDDLPGRDFETEGRIDLALLKKSLPHGRHQFYICGPQTMLESLVPALLGWGVPAGDVHYEAFGPASLPTPQAEVAGAPAEVHFARSGRVLAWDGRAANLLDFAETHGIATESGCRAGSCGACETRLVSGEVAYTHPPDHDIAPGHCLLCLAKPVTALELEA